MKRLFVPIARYTSIRLVLSLSVVMKWKIHQMDVKTTFLNGVVEEEVYVELLEQGPVATGKASIFGRRWKMFGGKIVLVM